ncbi:hypothetical protein [Xanthomonas dyei]|uniref:hypothetical protein n=1 Tax=Xanthomonas dyei TaxID=743699 RepID=UPI001E418FA8|nr:hypothetical protein [Xanthomonas dyei]MCC4632079.1 hypothetical protein [Xanthomonas dyei pv. eucalypti]
MSAWQCLSPLGGLVGGGAVAEQTARNFVASSRRHRRVKHFPSRFDKVNPLARRTLASLTTSRSVAIMQIRPDSPFYDPHYGIDPDHHDRRPPSEDANAEAVHNAQQQMNGFLGDLQAVSENTRHALAAARLAQQRRGTQSSNYPRNSEYQSRGGGGLPGTSPHRSHGHFHSSSNVHAPAAPRNHLDRMMANFDPGREQERRLRMRNEAFHGPQTGTSQTRPYGERPYSNAGADAVGAFMQQTNDFLNQIGAASHYQQNMQNAPVFPAQTGTPQMRPYPGNVQHPGTGSRWQGSAPRHQTWDIGVPYANAGADAVESLRRQTAEFTANLGAAHDHQQQMLDRLMQLRRDRHANTRN